MRARPEKRYPSRQLSERLYELGRVIDGVSRAYHGDQKALDAFLNAPHPLLDGDTPLEMARSSSAGAEAVLNLVRRAEAGMPGLTAPRGLVGSTPLPRSAVKA